MSGYKYLLFLLVFLMGCVPQQPISEVLPVAEKALVQCWDNSAVDSMDKCPSPKIEEVVVEEPVVNTVEKTLMQQLIENAPVDYFYYDGFDGIIVSGNKRSNGEYDPYWNSRFYIMYWDATKTLYILAPSHVQEWWWLQKQGTNQSGGRSMELLPAFFELHLTGNKEIDETLIPKEFNKYYFEAKENELVHVIRPFYSKGPMDWMKEYMEDVPLQIDNTVRLLSNIGGNFESNLSITYKNKGKTAPLIVFRFDKNLGVPFVIDEMDEKGKIVKRNSYEFGVDYISKQKREKISQKHVSLPEKSIIVSVKDYEEYWDYIG